MPDPRESFQLLFYRAFARRAAARRYALKGGACLRFHHGSPRLSEDVDYDVDRGFSRADVARVVDGILESRAFTTALAQAGIETLEVQPRSARKQTEVTQRWKLGLRLAAGIRLASRLEFSRRGGPLTRARSGVPRRDLLASHGVEAFVGKHYDAADLVIMKVGALAAPRRVAVRDLFDLQHLLSSLPSSGGVLTACGSEALLAAAGKVLTHTRERFIQEVAPFLPADLAEDHARRWDEIQVATANALEAAARAAR